MENVEMPESLDHFNFGAFLMAPLWSIYYGLPSAIMISLIPIFGWFVVALYGNEWLWEKGRPYGFMKTRPWTEPEFKRSQRSWLITGILLWLTLAYLIGLILYEFLSNM
jgi:hypothetical protein